MPFKPVEPPSLPPLAGTLVSSQAPVPTGFNAFFSEACRQPDAYHLIDDDTAVPLDPRLLNVPPPPLIGMTFPPDWLAMLPPALRACCNQLRQWRLRKGESNRLSLPEWGVTIMATRSALTSVVSVVLFVPPNELALYRQGAQQVNDRQAGVVIDIREGPMNSSLPSPHQGFGHDRT